MRRSISGVCLDLLVAHRSGNFSKFDRCYSKACEFLGLHLDDHNRKKTRAILFHFLRVNGHIDVSYHTGSTFWSAAPNAIVKCGPNYFVAMGSGQFLEDVRKVFAGECSTLLTGKMFLRSPVEEVNVFPELVSITSQDPDVITKAKAHDFNLEMNLQEKMFQSLPSLSEVLRTCLGRAEQGAIFEPNSTSKYDFDKLEWLPYGETRPFGAGLYRREFDYSPSEYIISTQVGRHMTENFKVIEREWVLVCALAKLNLTSVLEFKDDAGELLVPFEHDSLRYPNLLERCFRSSSFVSPDSTRISRLYSNVNQKNVWKLASKLPIFKVKVT